MSLLDSFLIKQPVSRIRRNHALEHATLKVLAQTRPDLSLAGYSDPSGFWIVGPAPTEELLEAVEKALLRLRTGEKELAIHPNCGTNFLATGLTAGTLAWLGMLGVGRGVGRKLERWPLIVALAALGAMLAAPLGPVLQRRVTTQADMGNLTLVGISVNRKGKFLVHHVITRG